MADFTQNQNSEDVEAIAAAKAEEKRKADEAARVEAEEKAKADAAAAAEAANQTNDQEENEPEATVSVVLDPEFAEAYGVDSATVGTAGGEYELSADAVEVPQSDVENVLASPAAKEDE